MIKLLPFVLVLVLLVSGCNKINEITSGSFQDPAPTTDASQICSPAEIAGRWYVEVIVFGVSNTRDVEINEEDVPGDNTIDYTDGDLTIIGTIDPNCIYMAGTAREGSLEGIWKADKL